MDLKKFTLDSLTDTGTLNTAITEQGPKKIKLLAPGAISDTSPTVIFHIIGCYWTTRKPIGTICLTFEMADFMFKANFIIMKVLPNPIIGFCFMKQNNAIFTSDKVH